MRDLPQLRKKPGTALVLSGGATKAFYFHLGVLKVLGPEPITSIVGSSAGAVMGAFIASGTTVETILNSLYQKQVYVPKFDTWIKTLTSTMLFRPKYQEILRQSLYTSLTWARFLASLPWLFNKDILAEALDTLVDSQSQLSGLFDSVALENMFKSLMPSANFAELETDLYVVATGLDHPARAVFNSVYDFDDEVNHFMTDVPIHLAVRASAAIPGIFEPIRIKGRYYIDGEVRQTLSADIGVRLADRVIISHTYQPLDLPGDESVRDLGWVNVLRQSLNIVLSERINVWRHIYQRQNPTTQIIWIQPDPDDVQFFLAPDFSFRPEVQREIIASGERAAIKAMERAGEWQRA